MDLVTVDKTQIDAVQTALATLTTDTSTALADIAAKISALQAQTADPATATELGNILTSVQALDAQVKGADPGPVVVNPSPAPAA